MFCLLPLLTCVVTEWLLRRVFPFFTLYIWYSSRGIKTILICGTSVYSVRLSVFLVSVQLFHLMIKETKNTGQWEHHILPESQGQAEDLKLFWLPSFSSLSLHFLAHYKLNILKFMVKHCITCTITVWKLRKGINILRLSTAFLPEEGFFPHSYFMTKLSGRHPYSETKLSWASAKWGCSWRSHRLCCRLMW